MTLGELIAALEKLPQDKVVKNGFGEPDSYRGYYCDLAFEPQEDVTIESMLVHAYCADGKTFTGYKGGEYQMNEFVDTYIAEYGCIGEPITSAHIRLWEIE